MNYVCPLHEIGDEKCGTYCVGRIQMKNILELSRIPKRYRKDIPLRPQVPEDREQFLLLRDWKDNVVDNVEDGKGLFIYSETKGTGKTTWACKILAEYLKHKALRNMMYCRGVYVNVPKFFDDLKESFNNPSAEFDELVTDIKMAELVVWDDIGAERPTDFVRDKLYTYIDYRYSNELSQIFTSNVRLEDLEMEQWLGERIVSRIHGSAEVIEFSTEEDGRR